MSWLQITGNFKDVEGADQIAVGVASRIVDRVPHTGLRGQVDDHIGHGRVCRTPQRVHVFQLSDVEAKGVVPLKQGIAGMLQGNVVIRRHPVEAGTE